MGIESETSPRPTDRSSESTVWREENGRFFGVKFGLFEVYILNLELMKCLRDKGFGSAASEGRAKMGGVPRGDVEMADFT